MAIDMTARNVQDEAKRKGLPWTIAKGFDTFLPLSDFITKEQLLDPHDAMLHLSVNDTVRQEDSTGLMLFRIPQLLASITQVMRLEAGDMVLSGTPKGVGQVVPGDVLRAAVSVAGRPLAQSVQVDVVQGQGRYEYRAT